MTEGFEAPYKLREVLLIVAYIPLFSCLLCGQSRIHKLLNRY